MAIRKWSSGIIVVTVIALAGCGRGATSSGAMMSVAAAAVGGAVAATARKKPKLSLDGAQVAPIEKVEVNYFVDANVDLPDRGRPLLDTIKSGPRQPGTSLLDGPNDRAEPGAPRPIELIDRIREARSP